MGRIELQHAENFARMVTLKMGQITRKNRMIKSLVTGSPFGTSHSSTDD